MFCPKCGAPLENATVCPNCSFDVNSIENATKSIEIKSEISSVSSNSADKLSSATQGAPSPIKTVIYCVLAAVVVFMFFSAASSVSESGLGIMDIQSVGGKTLEEAYYYELGGIYEGYAMAFRALGVFFGSVLVWLGFKK